MYATVEEPIWDWATGKAFRVKYDEGTRDSDGQVTRYEDFLFGETYVCRLLPLSWCKHKIVDTRTGRYATSHALWIKFEMLGVPAKDRVFAGSIWKSHKILHNMCDLWTPRRYIATMALWIKLRKIGVPEEDRVCDAWSFSQILQRQVFPGAMAQWDKILQEGSYRRVTYKMDDLSITDGLRSTALHDTAILNLSSLARAMVHAESPAEVDAKDEYGLTPLHQTAQVEAEILLHHQQGSVEVAEILLQHAATLDARNRDGNTPLHLTARQGKHGVAKLLLEHKADPNVMAKNKKRPIDCARSEGELSVAKLLEAACPAHRLKVGDRLRSTDGHGHQGIVNGLDSDGNPYIVYATGPDTGKVFNQEKGFELFKPWTL